MTIKLDAPGMKGNRTRNHNGTLRRLRSDKKVVTIQKEQGDSYLPGLPNDEIKTIRDARAYYSDAVGRNIVGIKKLHKMAVHDFLPSIPQFTQSNYLTRIALFCLDAGSM